LSTGDLRNSKKGNRPTAGEESERAIKSERSERQKKENERERERERIRE
jgi:hypothetical protein